MGIVYLCFGGTDTHDKYRAAAAAYTLATL